MRVLVTGATSQVGQSFCELIRERDIEVVSLGRHAGATIRCDLSDIRQIDAIATEIALADRLFICHGLMKPTPYLHQNAFDICRGMTVNLHATVRIIEHALQRNPHVRIGVVGSESARKGSFDTNYALSKAALHAYVRWRRIEHPCQQLVAIAPSMIGDAGMTTRRSDHGRVRRRTIEHPKARLVLAREVARLSHVVLFSDGMDYVTNTVIHCNGGKFAGLPL